MFDDDGSLLFEGDLTAISLEPVSSGGTINSAFTANVFNITATPFA